MSFQFLIFAAVLVSLVACQQEKTVDPGTGPESPQIQGTSPTAQDVSLSVSVDPGTGPVSPQIQGTSPTAQDVSLSVSVDPKAKKVKFIIHNTGKVPILYSDSFSDLIAVQKDRSGEWKSITNDGRAVDRAPLAPQWLRWAPAGQDTVVEKPWEFEEPVRGASIQAKLIGLRDYDYLSDKSADMWKRDKDYLLHQDLQSPIIKCP